MIKILAVLLAVLMLTSCGSRITTETLDGYEESSAVYVFSNLYNNGEFYEDGEKLAYIDFTTMAYTYICSKPNCLHNNSDECTAYGIVNHPVAVNGGLYYFLQETITNSDGLPQNNLVAYSASIDGSNRRKVTTAENIELYHSEKALLVGTSLYFVGTESEFDAVNFITTGNETFYLYRFDYSTESFYCMGELGSGYDGGATIYGEYNGKIYLTENALDEPWDEKWEDFDYMTEHWDEFTALYENHYYCYDIASESFVDWDMPGSDDSYDNFVVDSDYFITISGTTVTVFDSKGNESIYENFTPLGMSTYSVVNDMLFSGGTDRECINLKTGKRYNVSDYDGWVVWYLDGSYIIRQDDGYIKVAESELIGEEIA